MQGVCDVQRLETGIHTHKGTCKRLRKRSKNWSGLERIDPGRKSAVPSGRSNNEKRMRMKVPDEDNGDCASMEETTRLGLVELSREHIFVVADVR